MIKKISLVIFYLSLSSLSIAQMDSFSYKRDILNYHIGWNKLRLPSNIFSKTQPDLMDLRIYGKNKANEIFEAPYLIKSKQAKIETKKILYTLFNKTHIGNKYFYTFEISGDEICNVMHLHFENNNFNWFVKLEGSDNSKEWFTILNQYRILSIKNEKENFQFSDLHFDDTKFVYYRFSFESDINPELSELSIEHEVMNNGKMEKFIIENQNLIEDKKAKQSIYTIQLKNTSPISFLKFQVKDTFDYYRMMTIAYLADSTKNSKGWNYNYINFYSGDINSFDKNEFYFDTKITDKLKIIIYNADNAPLHLDSIELAGYEYELLCRINQEANYSIYYGNRFCNQAQYDLSYFEDKIPSTMPSLELGVETKINSVLAKEKVYEPLIKNAVWLWAVMIGIIILLATFSLKMIRGSLKN